jgi:hypothetical protein
MFILKILKIYVISSGFRKLSSCINREHRTFCQGVHILRGILSICSSESQESIFPRSRSISHHHKTT